MTELSFAGFFEMNIIDLSKKMAVTSLSTILKFWKSESITGTCHMKLKE